MGKGCNGRIHHRGALLAPLSPTLPVYPVVYLHPSLSKTSTYLDTTLGATAMGPGLWPPAG
jgi:hypothetical protein